MPTDNTEAEQSIEDNSDLHSDAVTDEISSAIDFDPFGPEDNTGDSDADSNEADASQTPSEEAEGDTADGSGDDAGQPAKTDTTGQQTEDGSQANSDLQEYLKQNQELLQQVVSGKSQGEDKTQDSKDEGEADPWSHVPSYDYNVPDQLVEMMGSEDPNERKQAMGFLVKGVAQGIHQQIMSTVGSQFQNLQQHIPQTVQQMQQTQAVQQQVATDFYGTYPEFNDPNITPIVQNVAKQVMEEQGKNAWDQSLRDEIGKRVKGILGKVAGSNTQQQQNTAPKTPANPPATFQNGGASSRAGGMKSQPTTQQDHIVDIMN